MKYILTILCLLAQLSAHSQSDWDEDDSPWGDDTEIIIPIGQEITQYIELKEGCNWVSVYIKGGLAVSGLAGTGVYRIQNQSEESIYDSKLGWVGPIKQLLPGIGYKVYSERNVTIPVRGYWCGKDSGRMELAKGWNWLGLPYFGEQPLVNAFSNPTTGDTIADENLSATYSAPKWNGTITKLLSGKSYLYKSENDKILIFK